MSGNLLEVMPFGGPAPVAVLSLSEPDLTALDEPLNILPDPEPHTKLGQQVLRLEISTRIGETL